MIWSKELQSVNLKQCDNSEVITRLAKLENSLNSVNKLIVSSKQDRECQCENPTTITNDNVLTHIELLPNNFEGGAVPSTNGTTE